MFGTYIGGVLPLLIALLESPPKAIAVLVYIVVYQQIGELPPGPQDHPPHHVAPSGACPLALRSRAARLMGIPGALMALPIAATVQAFVSTYIERHEVVQSPLTEDDDPTSGRRRRPRRMADVRRIVFVCTGNICRSPMAEAIARDLFGEDGVVFESAGVRAVRGRPGHSDRSGRLPGDRCRPRRPPGPPTRRGDGRERRPHRRDDRPTIAIGCSGSPPESQTGWCCCAPTASMSRTPTGSIWMSTGRPGTRSPPPSDQRRTASRPPPQVDSACTARYPCPSASEADRNSTRC